MKSQRKQAAQRRRRIIFNNDGNETAWAASATSEAVQRVNVTGLVGSNVDTMFYCTNHGFNNNSHNTKVSEMAYVTGAGVPDDPTQANIFKALIDQGTDPLKIMCEFSRRHDIEMFWSFRINDEHAAWVPDMRTQYVKDHPDHLLGTPEAPPPRGPWCGVDYAVPAVRDQAFAMIEEVCHEYDVDGVELDYFRQLTCFKKQAWGEPLDQADCDMMTDLLRRVRAMMDQVGAKKGRPLLLAVRVPDSVEFAQALGLDLMTWLGDELIDIMVPGGYFWLNPWKVSVKLGHDHGVPVYPSLDGSRLGAFEPEAGEIRRGDDAYRAHAADAFHAGADGIYVFNFNYFRDPAHLIWRQLGDPQVLAEQDKLYHVSVMGHGQPPIEHYLPGGEQYMNLPTLCPDRPVELSPGQSHSTTLRVVDDVNAWKRRPHGPYVHLYVLAEHIEDAGDLTVQLNASTLESRAMTWHGKSDGKWRQHGRKYIVEPHVVKQGINDLVISVSAGARACTIHDVQLAIDYELNGTRRRSLAQSRGRYVAHHQATV